MLFLDEVGERPYRLDRMVTQLAPGRRCWRAPRPWSSASCRGATSHRASLTARSVMADLFSDFPGPVLIGFPSGHTAGPAMTLPLGVSCRVVADTRPRLVIEEAAVD